MFSRHSGCRKLQLVSILVFVEDALEDAAHRSGYIVLMGFNPCFRGRCSGSVRVIYDIIESMQFQSLFSWKMLWKRFCSVAKFAQLGFQSLFSWKMLWKSSGRRQTLCARHVSILVFVEDALEGWGQFSKHHSNSRDQFSQRDPFGAILVFVEDALEGWDHQQCPAWKEVSILVFVEDALEAIGVQMPLNCLHWAFGESRRWGYKKSKIVLETLNAPSGDGWALFHPHRFSDTFPYFWGSCKVKVRIICQ